VDRLRGTWRVRIREIGTSAGKLREVPKATYNEGKGISLFTGLQISADYIKAKAQNGEMRSALYAVELRSPTGNEFVPPSNEDLEALAAAECELAKVRSQWERQNIIPKEKIPKGDKTGEPRDRGIIEWADMFSSRQLLGLGVLVEELRILQREIDRQENPELREAAPAFAGARPR
jgi:adenine-specific DNA methylase